MRKTKKLLLLLLITGFSVIAWHSEAQAAEADVILKRMEEVLFPESYRMRMEMLTLESDGRERNMEMTVSYRRGTGSYIEVEAPARSRGTRFLQRDNSLWMFIPRSNSRNAIRLSGRDSFQGSVFSNRDIGESMYTEDYEAELGGTGNLNHPELGEISYNVIRLSPRHNEASYGLIIALVETETAMPVKMEYFVRSGMKIKEMEFSEIKTTAGRSRPHRMEMTSMEEEKSSIINILELEADDALPDRIFSQQYLTR